MAPPPPPTLTLLHTFALHRGTTQLDRFGTRQEERLLAYLALRSGSARSRLDIVRTFWPGVEPAAARDRLSLYLFKLNERLARSGVTDAIEDARETLRLSPAIRTDAQTFAELVLAGTVAHSPIERAEHLQAAVEMYGDGLLPAYDYAWVQEFREQLDVLYRHAVSTLADLLDPSGGMSDVLRNMPPAAWRGLSRMTGAKGAADPARTAGEDVGGPGERGADSGALEGADTASSASDPPPVDLGTLAALVDEAARALNGVDRTAAIERLDGRLANIRAVLAQPPAVAAYPAVLRMAADLWRYWYVTGRAAEGRTYLDHLLALGWDVPRELRAAALHAAGTLANLEGDHAVGIPRLREAAEAWHIVGDDRALLSTVINLALARHDLGDFDEARAIHAQAIRVARRLGEERSLARALYNAALTELKLGDVRAARTLFEERLALPISTKDPLLRGVTHAHLASAALLENDRRTARTEAAAALSDLAAAPTKDLRAEALTQCVVGCIHLYDHRPDDARQALEIGVEQARSANDMGLTGKVLGYLAIAHQRLGAPDLAAQCTMNARLLLRSAGEEDALARFEASLEAERPASVGGSD